MYDVTQKKTTQNIVNVIIEVCIHLKVREGELGVWSKI